MDMDMIQVYNFSITSQGSYGSWKSWKVLEFYSGIFNPEKLMQVLESPGNL